MGGLRWTWQHARGWLIALAVIIVLLVAARLALPSVVKSMINDRLAAIPEHEGSIQGVRISLWRGAYALEELVIRKIVSGTPEPFIEAREIEFSVAWRELLRGEIKSDATITGADVTYVRTPVKEELDADRRWQDTLQDLVPIHITRLEVGESRFGFRDQTSEPVVDMAIKDLLLVITDFTNRPSEDGEEMPAELMLIGDAPGGGRVIAFGKVAPLSLDPHFELRLTVEGVDVSALASFMEAYANLSVKSGTFAFFFEVAAKEGRFEGYAKPFFVDMEFEDLSDQDKNLIEKAGELVMRGLVRLLENNAEQQVAVRAPFAGVFGDPKVGFWETLRTLLRNAFIEALPTGVENSISTEDVPTEGKAPAPSGEAEQKSN